MVAISTAQTRKSFCVFELKTACEDDHNQKLVFEY